MYLYKSSLKNPILEGYRYQNYLENTPDVTYKDIANHFGVSKARVSQMIALVTKLPGEILNCLEIESDPDKLKYFIERRLRPLTLLKSDEEKIERFEEIKYDVS